MTGDRIEIAGGEAVIRTEGGRPKRVPLPEFLRRIDERLVGHRATRPFFDGVRFHVSAGQLSILIVELPPALRSLLWATDDSPESLFDLDHYTPRSVATPYVILKLPFIGGRLHHTCELFFRPAPLERSDDPLYWSNLRNVTPEAYGCVAWLCTLGLRPELARSAEGKNPPSVRRQVELLLEHLWGGGFNASSDLHEGNSCFAKAATDGLDPRVTEIDRWERASREDFRFVLDVGWTPTGETIESVIDRELGRWKVPRSIERAPELIEELSARPRGAPRRRTA